jgi:hypothetical protein
MGAIISFVLQGLLSLYTFFAWQCSQGGYRFGPVLVRDCIRRLEHVPKYLLDFFDQIMLQFFGAERFIFDDISPSAGHALWTPCRWRRNLAGADADS